MKSSRSARARHALASVGLVLGLVTAGSVVLATSASAAALTVTSSADVATNFGACGNTAQTTSSGSLREAVCAANNAGATSSTITVAAGTYSLTNGELQMGKVAGSNIALTGSGAGNTIIQGNGTFRIFNFDPNTVGRVNTTVSGVTITGGFDSDFGGGGIIAGSTAQPTGAPLDDLTVNNSTITNNHASGGSNTGGGLAFSGGHLTITNSTISNNTSNGAGGSGVWYRAEGTGPGEGLTISGSTLSGNSVSTGSVKVGGALQVEAVRSFISSVDVSNSRFLNNTVIGSGAGTPVGGAIWAPSGVVNVTESTFTGNSVSGGTGPVGGAINVSGATVNLHYNRFTGNTGASGQAVSLESGTVDATDNWWGCNTGPGTAGCDSVAGSPTVSPRLVLIATASPSTVIGPNATSTVTAALTQDSVGGAIGASNLDAFAGLPVAFTDPLPSGATLTTGSANISSGSASTTYNSQNASGPGHVLATLDNGTATATVTVNRPPAITSTNAVTFSAGTASTFTVTTTGHPAPAITKTGTVPPGMTFTDNGNGTATLAGTPTAGGVYPLSLTANNGVAPNATQTLTVTVNQSPAFTSPNTATFQVGTAGSFSITTTPTAYPTPVTITNPDSVPAGLTFTDNGNGTATLAGTPAAGSGGSYSLHLKAGNGISPDGTQTLTVTVNQPPAVTTNPADQTVDAGSSVSFIAAASGFPAPTVQWQRSTNGGGTFTNIAGATNPTYTFTAAAGDNGNKYRAVFSNTSGSATSTAATLVVHSAPTISSANSTSFSVGTAGSFTVTTAGFPNPTLTTTGTLPAWLSFTDNGNGTATLAGTPAAGSGGQYSFTINADNGTAPSDSQPFTLTVDEPPTISSADHTSFQVGTNGTFPVTTSPGYPTATTVSKRGTLPSGVTFTPDGSGGATLAGTPAAGTGGSYPITITAGNGASPPATQSFTLTVTDSPQITSADHTTFTVGTAGTFAVTSSGGMGNVAVSESGTLPSGVTFTDNGDSTATLAGTPAATTGGTYPLTFTASDGVTANDVQNFTLTVNEPPAISSADHDTFTRGANGSFTVTTTPGVPATTTITKTGSLPTGVSFTDNGDGTATIAGTPTVGGSFPITITASNGVAPDAVQAFTLTVDQAPDITSADHTTFTAGNAGSFTVTTSPPADTVTVSGDTLPPGVTFTDNGDGTATLAGTPAIGTGGVYQLSIKATNPTGFTSQPFTLTVDEPPTITSTDQATFTIGSAGNFTVTTIAGYPTATTLMKTGSLPVGVSFTDNSDGTATLGGTPAAGSDGSYPLTITAANTADHATQSFTLTVVPANASPTITSADHATFHHGSAGSFTVTTTAGYPAATTVTETGSLPAGVTFTDHGDGTGTLAGTPTVNGSFPITITASNGATSDATQPFTLTVDQPPTTTSGNHTTFTVGAAGSFTVTTTAGYPTATTLTENGSLPTGVSFTDNGDGTATLAGTPTAGTAGSYPLTITATNSAGHPDQAFTLTVNQIPVFTSADHTSFVYGSPGTFTVLTNPTAATITKTGTLPSGVTFTDNGDGTATLAGTPSQVGSYPLTLTGSNGPGATATQAFTLTTTQIPTGTTLTSSANPSTYGTPVTFTATVTPTNGAGGVSFYRDGSPTAIPACTTQPLTLNSSQYQSTCTLSTLGAGNHTLHAVYEGTAIYQASSSDLPGGQQITQQTQTIQFPPIANRSIIESPFTPSGVTGGNSGNPITYTATGGNCSANGTRITLTHTGSCTLTAHQAGTPNYTPAAPVTRSFTITSKPTLRIADSNTVEGNSGTHPLTFRITMDKPVSGPVTVHWVTANGSATAPSDYTNAGGTLTFAPGQTLQTVSVAIKGDRVKEANEVMFILLNGATNATIIDPNASGGILNDD